MKRYRAIVAGILFLIACNRTLAQGPTPKTQESHKYRTILTLAGGGGGFTLGVFGGLAAFDDATNSDRKVWTTAILSAAAGGVAGYFLGRSLDKRRRRPDVTRSSDEFYQRLTCPEVSSGAEPFVFSQRQLGLEAPHSPSLQAPPPIGNLSSRDLSRIYLATALKSMSPALASPAAQNRYFNAN